MKRLILLMIVFAGCKDNPPAAAPTSAAPTSAAPASGAPFDPVTAPADGRSAVDFAAAWVAILQQEDEELRLKQGDSLGPTWQGRRYTWTGLALASLCFEHNRSCALQVFTADLPERGRLGGTLPLVSFRAEAWPKIKAGCGGQEQCVLRFEAALIEARTDPEQALRLVFVDGQLLETRAPAPGELWFRPPVSPAPGASPGSLRVDKASPASAPLLPKKVF